MQTVRNIESGDIEVAVDIHSAVIRSIKCHRKSLMVGRHGYVAVEDRTNGEFYFKPEQNTPAIALEGDGLTVTQTDASADMVLTQKFAAEKNSISWSVSVTTQREDTREIHLHFVVPVFGPVSHGFTANAKCPLLPGKDDHMMTVYGPNQWNEEIFHCSVLPLISAYDPAADTGLAVIQPVDVKKPRMEYFFVRQQPDISMVIRWTHLRLDRSKSVEAKMLLVPIKGCWRDAVRSIHDLYPDHFRVHGEAIFAHEGLMSCDLLTEDHELNDLASEGLRWQELHASFFEHFGDYAPQTEKWPNWVKATQLEYFDLERLSRTEFRDMAYVATNDEPEVLMSRQKVNDYIAKLKRKKVASYVYINPVILDLDYVKDFPDSLAESAEGTSLLRDYYRNASMYPDISTEWGRYLVDMAERQMDLFPEAAGFFLDELHWNQFDFAHDDGVSARGNKKIAMLGFAVQQAAKHICDAAHKRGKAVWANGPTTLEVIHYVDGFMAECSSEWLGSVRFLGLEKPLVLLAHCNMEPDKFKNFLNSALLAGAQPGLQLLRRVIKKTPDHINPENIKLWRQYRPMFDLLLQRRWILSPHAIVTESPALKTNCFLLPGGNFAVTFSAPIVSDSQLKSADGYVLSKDNIEQAATGSIKIKLAWPGIENVRSIKLFSAFQTDVELNRVFDGKTLVIDLDISQVEAGLLLLKTK